MTSEEILIKWKSLPPDTRRRIILTDKSMKHPTWIGLVERLATTNELTALQADMLTSDPYRKHIISA